MSLTHAERGRRGGLKVTESMTADQRKDRARAGYLARCVKEVVDRAPELRPEQVDRLRTIFAGDVPDGAR